MKQNKLFKRSLLFALLTAPFAAYPAMGQSTSTGPNKVYIEQIGDSNTINIQQIGGTNNVGGTAGNTTVGITGVTTHTPDQPSVNNYATINGSSNQLTINQTGDNNSAQYNVRGSFNVYSSTVAGNGNQTKLVVGTANIASNYNTITESITGDNNLIIQNVTGGNVNSNVQLVGSTNQVTTELSSARGNALITINGSNNIINAQQTDAAGAIGHVLVNQITNGDYNSITTQQQGTNDTTVNIQTAGSHNTITVRSSSSTIIDPKTAVAR